MVAAKKKLAQDDDPFLNPSKVVRPKPAQRRLELRNSIWPGSPRYTWDRKAVKGFTTVPRLLPHICHLITELHKSGDASMVYIELWCRSYDESFLEIENYDEMAFAAGYSGSRAVRTWSERMRVLRSLGFIDTRQSGNVEFGMVLLLDPLIACANLRFRPKKPGNPVVSNEWWSAFVARAAKIGAVVPQHYTAIDLDAKE